MIALQPASVCALCRLLAAATQASRVATPAFCDRINCQISLRTLMHAHYNAADIRCAVYANNPNTTRSPAPSLHYVCSVVRAVVRDSRPSLAAFRCSAQGTPSCARTTRKRRLRDERVNDTQFTR